MPVLFHVTSVLNRESILANGLDPGWMGFAPGIAGSRQPEVDGCFLCEDEFEVDWFVSLNNTGGPVDVWAVDGIDVQQLVMTPNNHLYFPGRIPAQSLTLERRDLPASTFRGMSSQ